MLAAAVSAYAQDGDSKIVGAYIQKVDFVDPATGLQFAIKSYDPCYVSLMNSGELYVSNHVEIAERDLYRFDEGYMNMPAGEYSGDVVIPDMVQKDRAIFTVQRISYGTFNQCTELTSVTIPLSVTEVRRGAFYGCTALEEVKLSYPDQNRHHSFTNFYPDVFRGCTSLRKVDLSNAQMFIGGIFADCPNLEEVTMYCFYNHADAFSGRKVPSLKKINLLLDDEAGLTSFVGWERDQFFEDEFQNTILTVPAGTTEGFRNHKVWGRFVHIVEREEASLPHAEVPAAWELRALGDRRMRISGEFGRAEVVSLQGMHVAYVDPQAPEFEVPSHGIYIITVDGHASTVLF